MYWIIRRKEREKWVAQIQNLSYSCTMLLLMVMWYHLFLILLAHYIVNNSYTHSLHPLLLHSIYLPIWILMICIILIIPRPLCQTLTLSSITLPPYPNLLSTFILISFFNVHYIFFTPHLLTKLLFYFVDTKTIYKYVHEGI